MVIFCPYDQLSAKLTSQKRSSVELLQKLTLAYSLLGIKL
uniref:Uncharacterized protein n=1 Tax=Enterococcus faecium TaxID=1352 RepID=A0A2S0T1L2_ENTFC|nr:hypothetical protein [Enterococcus faecium]